MAITHLDKLRELTQKSPRLRTTGPIPASGPITKREGNDR